MEALSAGYKYNNYLSIFQRKENESMESYEKILMDRIILQPSSFSLKNDDSDIERVFLNAQRTLRVLGAFDDKNHITQIGRQMAYLPINVYSARMLVEAQSLGVADDVLTIVSCLEAEGLKHRKAYYSDFGITEKSDLLSELALFKLMQAGKAPTPFGLLPSHFEKALDIRNDLDEAMYDVFGEVSSKNTGNSEKILQACFTGLVDFLYIRGEHGWYTNPHDPKRRKLNLTTSAIPQKFVIGMPINIPMIYELSEENKDVRMLYVLTFVTSFSNPDVLLYRIAPQLVEEIQRDFFHFESNSYRKVSKKFFNEVLIEETSSEITKTSKKIQVLLDWFIGNTISQPEDSFPKELQEVFSSMSKISSEKEELNLLYMKLLRKTFGSGIPNLTKKKNLVVLLQNAKKMSA